MASPLPRLSAQSPAYAGIGAEPHHEVRGIPGQFDDLVPRHAGHRRARDRSAEPVAGRHELGLRLGVERAGVVFRPRPGWPDKSE
jgi:hypothetical protein